MLQDGPYITTHLEQQPASFSPSWISILPGALLLFALPLPVE
jgi:hypothetical protein